jgi:hypothetical protein
VEVNAKAGHVLKTEKKELEVREAKRIWLEHDDRIIRILQMGDAALHKVRDQPCNVPSPRGCLKDGSKGLNRKVKKERGERIPLADAAAVTEVIPNFPVDRDRRLAPRDQTHGAMDPSRVKAFPKKDFAKELPVDSVKRLLEIKLKENSPKFPRLGLMDDLLKRNYPFKDVSAFNKGGLRATDDAVSNRGNTNRVGFGNEFKDHIKESNGPKLPNVVSTLDFRNQREDSKV